MPTLIIMAAGMGSRYGGLKQIDPVGPGGETIIDYSVYDAVRAGFEKVVFVIRPDFKEPFREKADRSYARKVECAYAFQELTSGVEGFDVPREREKPWGTGQAVLVAEPLVKGPFVVINADDYYGVHSFQKMAHYLSSPVFADGEEYAMVGFVLRNTLSEHGYVSRGVCDHDPSLYLRNIVERLQIFKNGEGAYWLDEAKERHELTADEMVSMNFWGFQPSFFSHLKREFNLFLRERGQELKSEFFIPYVVDRLIAGKKARVKIVPTEDTWFGVTYKEDKEVAQGRILELIEKGIYPEDLWA